MAWIYLFIAALFETAWTYSVKYLSFAAFRQLTLANFYSLKTLAVVAPLVGYIVFGISNVYFFSLAIKQVPTAVAFAVWTAATLVLIKVTEVLILHQRLSWPELFFMLLIMVGIIGLRYQAAKV